MAPAGRAFSNCTDMHTAYPHGVRRPGAVDLISGRPSLKDDATVDSAEYDTNTGLDRDRDGVACEKE